MEITKTRLANDKTFIALDEEKKEVYGGDYTDLHNEPRFYNITKRSMKKAWALLVERFNEETSMYNAMEILREGGVKTHSYCSMD